jgi:ABC-type dipeptide transport system, periplasmic component
VNYIVPKHVYAGSDPVTNPANNAPIATGPWKFKEWVRGSHFEYVRTTPTGARTCLTSTG